MSDAVLKVGLLGLGTVGCGTLAVLRRNADVIARRAGRRIEVVAASVRDLDKARPVDIAGVALTDSSQAVVAREDVEVVVELMGGIEPALGLVRQALALGKPVVTANKALIALHGDEIFALAGRKDAMVAFEAAVAGGIPVIKTAREALAGNRIEWLTGIINGTCNYILSAMTDDGLEFEAVLAEAQSLGYAEADPTFDVDGIDAAHKLTILASIAFGIPLQFDKLYIEGIRGITPEDIKYAQRFGYRIKHLGIARHAPGGIELRVHPTLVPEEQLLASVAGAMNAVMIQGDAAGPILLYGAGAGAEPTASAVVADIVDVARSLHGGAAGFVPPLAFHPDTIGGVEVLPMAEVQTAYYLRLRAVDRPGVLADIARILGDGGISIEAILQPEPGPGDETVPIVILTHVVGEGAMNAAIVALERLQSLRGPVNRIRMETFS